MFSSPDRHIPRDVGLGVFGPELPMGKKGRDEASDVAFLWGNPSEAEARALSLWHGVLSLSAQFTHESYIGCAL